MKQLNGALTRTCLVLALAGTLFALSACAPAPQREDAPMAETVTVVAAVQPAATPANPAAAALPPTATLAPATATPTPPTATPAGPAAAAVQPPATPTPAAAPVEPAPLGAPSPSSAGSPVTAPAVVEAPPSPATTATGTAAPASSLAGILVSYRLDPWLFSATYGAGFWVSPPTLGPTTQNASTFVLQVRAQGLTAQGAPVLITPEWIPADPDMVLVSPPQGNDVVITVQRAGQTSLQVAAQGVSKTLSITAAFQSSALMFSISQ